MKKSFKVILIILVALFILKFLVDLTSDSNSNPSGSASSTKTESPKSIDKEELARQAFIISQDYVKKNLKAPSTAKFPFLDYTFSDPDPDNTIIIKSYVDAQNSFGAKLRNDYYVKVRYKGGDWADIQNWELIKLEFVNQ